MSRRMPALADSFSFPLWNSDELPSEILKLRKGLSFGLPLAKLGQDLLLCCSRRRFELGLGTVHL